jgi:hypothetical protein
MPARAPITESPWFWMCLFASMGLMGLWAIGQRYGVRQTQVEQKAQARLRAAERAGGGEVKTEVSSRGHLEVSLEPLYLVLGAVLIFAWAVLWWNHFRPRSPAGAPPAQEQSA